jgi:hypothetical protein
LLQAGETRTSIDMPLPAPDGSDGDWIIKLAATDQAGHRVAAWVEVAGGATALKKASP